MGAIEDARKKAIAGQQKGPTCPADFKKRYPALALVLEGTRGKDKGEGFPPYTLKLSLCEEGIRICLSSWKTKENWYGPPAKSEDVLAHVDACIGVWKFHQYQPNNGKGPATDGSEETPF